MGKNTSKLTVIFDFDGTLADTLDLGVAAYNKHAQEFGLKKVRKSDYSRLRTMGYKKGMKELGIRWYMTPRLLVALRSGIKKVIHKAEPYDGMVGLVKVLRKQGVSIGILTSNDADLVQGFLKEHRFPPFDFVVSEKIIFGKHKALNKIIDRHSLDKARVIYVGDEPRDVTSSKKAGIRAFGVTWGFGGVESMEPAEPDQLFGNVADLEKALVSEV